MNAKINKCINKCINKQDAVVLQSNIKSPTGVHRPFIKSQEVIVVHVCVCACVSE